MAIAPAPRAAPVEALLFDLNGTLSDDEQQLFQVYEAMFATRGVTLSRDDYLARLAGKSDEELFRSLLGDEVEIGPLVQERVDRYVELVGDGSTVSADVRSALAVAASRVRVGVVTSAWRDEAEAVLRGSRLWGFVSALVCADDVDELKPSPEPYMLACKRLNVASSRAFAVEDTEVGIASAQAAGVRCAGLTSTMPRERLRSADLLLDALDRSAIDLLLCA